MSSSPVSKAIAAFLAGIATLITDAVTLGLLSGSARIWATLAATFVGGVMVNVIAVYSAPANATTPGGNVPSTPSPAVTVVGPAAPSPSSPGGPGWSGGGAAGPAATPPPQ